MEPGVAARVSSSRYPTHGLPESGDAVVNEPRVVDHPLPRRPSQDPDELAKQLQRALARFERESGEEGGDDETLALCRGYLDHALALAWRGACAGNLEAPRTLLKPLLVVQVVAQRLAPEPVTPRSRVAAWVEGVVHALRLGDQALEVERISARLENPQRSGLERAVLDVLAGAGGYLRRGEVYARLDAASRPTRVRVGQVLNELHHDGLLLRTRRRARGNRDTRFYALSEAGRTLFKHLKPVAAPAPSRPTTREPTWAIVKHIEKTVTRLLGEGDTLSRDIRGILTGLLANIPVNAVTAKILHQQFAARLAQGALSEDARLSLQAIEATWAFRLSALAGIAEGASPEFAMLRTLRETIQERLHPAAMRIFRVSTDDILVPDEYSGAAPAHSDLLRLVNEARKRSRSRLRRLVEDGHYGWAFHDGSRVDFACELQLDDPQAVLLAERMARAYAPRGMSFPHGTYADA